MSTVVKKQGWIRRLVGYMKPHKKNAYVAFGVWALAIGGLSPFFLLFIIPGLLLVAAATWPSARAV